MGSVNGTILGDVDLASFAQDTTRAARDWVPIAAAVPVALVLSSLPKNSSKHPTFTAQSSGAANAFR
jgi:hypothetical protein